MPISSKPDMEGRKRVATVRAAFAGMYLQAGDLHCHTFITFNPLKMKKFILFFISLPVFVFSGCDVIDETDRITEMEEVIPLKKVLLLDFTDQACPNCPKAGFEVANLEESYGEAFIPVTIHASSRNLPLVTKDGNAYDIHFGTRETGHPSGIIDGGLFPDYYSWGGAVMNRFNVLPSLNIELSVVYREESREVKLTSQLKGLRDITQAKLLLWVVENNIIDKQLVDNTTVNDYEHHHIFRASINSTWGEEISLAMDEEKTLEHTCVLDNNWKPENISIVGFVYDAASDEVFDVAKIHLFN
jgi:hypothetical protein